MARSPGSPGANALPGDRVSVRFVEEMTGFITFGEPDERRALRDGRRSGTRLTVHLGIRIESEKRFAADSVQGARADGWVSCDALGGRELPVEAGTFDLFVDGASPDQKLMLYRLFFRDGVGHPLTLAGCKTVGAGFPWHIWRDTSTLSTRILRGHAGPVGEANAELVASGILRLHPVGFLRQLTTFRADAPSRGAALVAIGRFDAFFVRRLWSMYGRDARRLGERIRSRRDARAKG